MFVHIYLIQTQILMNIKQRSARSFLPFSSLSCPSQPQPGSPEHPRDPEQRSCSCSCESVQLPVLGNAVCRQDKLHKPDTNPCPYSLI